MIENIIIKIDTQGYEDKVLEGSIETIKNNKVSIVLTEIMFDNVYDKYFSSTSKIITTSLNIYIDNYENN